MLSERQQHAQPRWQHLALVRPSFLYTQRTETEGAANMIPALGQGHATVLFRPACANWMGSRRCFRFTADADQ